MAYTFSSLDKQLLEKAADISWLVLDVDGIMTDGALLYNNDGKESKRFHARDGLGLRMWREAGFELAMITARRSQVVEHRGRELGVSELHQKVGDKRQVLEDLCQRHSIAADNVAFMGDDMVDYRAMQYAGVALTVADAYPLIVELADWQSHLNGGNGAVREACELLLYSKGLLQQAHARYMD